MQLNISYQGLGDVQPRELLGIGVGYAGALTDIRCALKWLHGILASDFERLCG